MAGHPGRGHRSGYQPGAPRPWGAGGDHVGPGTPCRSALDELEGQREAARRALTVTGVLGVLERVVAKNTLCSSGPAAWQPGRPGSGELPVTWLALSAFRYCRHKGSKCLVLLSLTGGSPSLAAKVSSAAGKKRRAVLLDNATDCSKGARRDGLLQCGMRERLRGLSSASRGPKVFLIRPPLSSPARGEELERWASY